MSITQAQIEVAQNRQHNAAHDENLQVRLIAGPGSGKSFAIQERVKWLLEREISPDTIYVISFTRASTLDLRNRIIEYCKNAGLNNVEQINISTLHSLALRALRVAGLLTYPADPLVLDDFELDNILDIEFSRSSGYIPKEGVGYSPGRCKTIRIDYEAFCGTGQWEPPNNIPPSPPISQEERQAYKRFHNPRTQIYSCVLPGEIVRQCVVNMQAGLLNPVSLLNIQQLIVDEYQDLNPTDLEFIDRLIQNRVTTFVAGDDDQSIYSFRFASPQGIQSFLNRFPQASDHELRECFRCASSILDAARNLIDNHSEPIRIPKNLTSLYLESDPPVTGVVHRWRFRSFITEARAIAESCSRLIEAGISPNKIMILISNKRALLKTIIQQLDEAGVKYEAPKSDGFFETSPGRFILAMLRIICNSEDYVAHRLILGLRPGVGPVTCNNVAESTIQHNLNFHDLFYQPIPNGVLQQRELLALNHARQICGTIEGWSTDETLENHGEDITNLVGNIFGEQAALGWKEVITDLPRGMTLEELVNYFRADTDEQQASLLEEVYNRLEIQIPEYGLLPPKVRIMTMHSAKGLSAQVIFIPGLMEEILPGQLRRPYPGLVLEAARMLYVSVTRARAACIASFSTSRVVYGKFSQQTPSRFVANLAGVFSNRENGLSDDEVDSISEFVQNL
jgi:superfamily I DNA/RNA helicase